MTREEVIEEVKNYENYPNGLSKECRDYIIQVLEQEPILDKIRAEIKGMTPTYHNPNWSITDLVPISEVLDVIDKYRAESEE